MARARRRTVHWSLTAGSGCPFLGLRADPASVFLEPTPEHRCYATGREQRIEPRAQASYCLTAAFERCPQFVAVQQGRPVPFPQHVMIRAVDGGDPT